MKCSPVLISLVFTAILTSGFSACSSSGGTETETSETPIVQPDMGTAKDLPDTGGTKPATEADAVSLFTGTIAGMNQSKSAAASLKAASMSRSISTVSEPISFTSDDGKTIYSGTAKYTTWIRDTEPLAGTTNDYMAIDMRVDLAAKLTTATVTNGTTTYVVSGNITEAMAYSFDMATTLDAQRAVTAYNYTLYEKIGIGFALSVKSGTIGAKFIVSILDEKTATQTTDLTGTGTGTGTTLTGPSEGDSPLKDATITLYVYDDDDTLRYTDTSLTFADLEGFTPSDFMEDDSADTGSE